MDMDKNKLIEDILMEWAMRSPDGLVGGHDTMENMEVLNEILTEQGLDELDMGDFGVTDKLAKRKKGRPAKLLVPRDTFWRTDKKTGKTIVVGHKNYANGTFLDDIKANSPKVPFYTAAETAKQEMDPELRQKRINDNVWEDLGAPNGKAVPANSVAQIKNELEKSKVVNFAKSIYNQKSLKEALALYNTNSGNEERFVNAMNAVKHHGLGRGELAFVFMLENVKSGGTGDVDLINVQGYGKVEVKEAGSAKTREAIRISSSTLAGFSNSEIKKAIENLAQVLRENSELGDFLVKVLDEKDPATNEYYYPGGRPASSKELEIFKDWVKSPNTADMPKGIFRCLVIISVKLELPIKRVNSASKVAITVGKDKQEFKTDPSDTLTQLDALNKAATDAPNKSHRVTLKVAPAADTSGDQRYKDMAMDLKFFDRKYNLATISEEITELLIKKYKAMLIVSAAGENKAEVIDTDSIKLVFDGMAQNMIACTVETNFSNKK